MTPVPRRAAAVLLVLLALAGCDAGGGADQPPPAGAAASPAVPGADAEAPDTGPAQDPEEPVARPSPQATVTVDLPRDQALDLQVNHPNGTTFVVRAVSFHEDRTQIDFTATNGRDSDIELGVWSSIVLRDDLGTTYRFSEPPGNPSVLVTRQSTIEGTLVFLGRVAPGARQLTLITNPRGNNTMENTTTPTIVVDGIPVERDGSGGASEDPAPSPAEASDQAGDG